MKVTKMTLTRASIACMKTLLLFFNFIFWVAGIVVLALGIWVKLELYRYIDVSPDFNTAIPYVLIALGALIVIIGSFACCYTVKGQPIFLYIYSAFLFVIFMGMLGSGIAGYLFRDELQTGFETGLNQSIQDYGTKESITTAFDDMQTFLHCCGVNNYTDWVNTPWHDTSNTTVPQSCCREKDCVLDPLDEDEIYTEGCYSLVLNSLGDNLVIVGGVTVGLAFTQLLGSLLACALAKAMYQNFYIPIH